MAIDAGGGNDGLPANSAMRQPPRDASPHVVRVGREEWGPGRILGTGIGVTQVFFIDGGRRRIDATAPVLTARPVPDEEVHRVLDLAAAVDWGTAQHNIYVIELDAKVCRNDAFISRNLDYLPGRLPCVYVGLTGLEPEERFKRHLWGRRRTSS